MKPQDASLFAMIALLSASTVNHVRNPKFYYSVVPRALCKDRNGIFGIMTRDEWVAFSAALEAAAVVGLMVPATRKTAATATAAMFAGFTAGHLSALFRAFGPTGTSAAKKTHLARLPLQLPLVLWAWSLRRA